MIAALILIQNVGFPFSRWLFLLLGLVGLLNKKRLDFRCNEPLLILAILLAYIPIISFRLFFDASPQLTFDLISTLVYSCVGILLVSQARIEWERFGIFHASVSAFIIVCAGVLICYSSAASNFGVRTFGLSGNDNRMSCLLVVCLIVVSKASPRSWSIFLWGLLLFTLMLINSRGAIIALILWPIFELIFRSMRDRRVRFVLSIILYGWFCICYVMLVYLLDDNSSQIRSGFASDIIRNIFSLKFLDLESHFSLFSFVLYYGPLLFLILPLLFWFFGSASLLLALTTCSFVSEIFAVPWLLYAYVINISRHEVLNGN